MIADRRTLLLLLGWLTLWPATAADLAPQTMTPMPGRPAAREFALPDMDKKIHRLSEARGHVTMVNFWATWCPPCRRELPSMQRAWESLKPHGFAMYAINLGEDEEAIFPFILSTGVEITFPILLDRRAEIVKQWPVLAIPTTFVLDRDGRIVYRAVGGREWDDPKLLETIRVLMRE
jgi:thiol-disulfide isomerase/thioredoxin